jgi:hypothetical protein
VKHDVLSKYLTYSEDRQPAAIMNQNVWNLLSDEQKSFYSSFAKIDLQPEDNRFLAQELILHIEDYELWVKRLVDLIQVTDDDALLNKHAANIRMIWRRQISSIPEHFEIALRKMLHKRRQNIMGRASLQPGQLLQCVNGYWVCQAPVSEVFSDNPITGYYRNFQTNDAVEYGQSHELPVTITIKSLESSKSATQALRDRHQLHMEMLDQMDTDHPINELEAAIKRDHEETLKAFFKQRSTEPPVPGASADSTMTGSHIIESNDLPDQGEQDVNGERNELPGKATLTTSPVAALDETRPDCSGETEYISDIVPASPKDDKNRPRRSARMPRIALTSQKPRFGPPSQASTTPKTLVIPEPRSDTDSETESMPASPQGRPALSGKATARA